MSLTPRGNGSKGSSFQIPPIQDCRGNISWISWISSSSSTRARPVELNFQTCKGRRLLLLHERWLPAWQPSGMHAYSRQRRFVWSGKYFLHFAKKKKKSLWKNRADNACLQVKYGMNGQVRRNMEHKVMHCDDIPSPRLYFPVTHVMYAECACMLLARPTRCRNKYIARRRRREWHNDGRGGMGIVWQSGWGQVIRLPRRS